MGAYITLSALGGMALLAVTMPEPAGAALGVSLVCLGFVLARRKWRRETGRKSFTPPPP